MIDFNLENACLLMNKMRYFAVLLNTLQIREF